MKKPDETPEALFARAPWEDLPLETLGAAAGVPSMLNNRERLLYLWLGAHWATGAGAVVDLGCFVGGSTACLAQGLSLAGHATPVHAYDRFTANDAAKVKFMYPAGVAPFEGRDTLPLARSLLAPWGERIAFHRGEILQEAWPGDPIELLVIDIAKTPEVADHVATTYFPALIPGRSILVHQDFAHDAQPWLPAQMELFARQFTPLAHVAPHSVAYLCTAAVTAADVTATRTASLDDASLLRLLAGAQERLAGFGLAPKLEKAAAKVRANPGVRQAGRLRKAGRK